MVIQDIPPGVVVMKNREDILDQSVVVKGTAAPPSLPVQASTKVTQQEPPNAKAAPTLGGISCEDIGVASWYEEEVPERDWRSRSGVTVFLPSCMRSLSLVNMHHATIYAGPVRGPVYVDGCTSCLIIAAGHQVPSWDIMYQTRSTVSM